MNPSKETLKKISDNVLFVFASRTAMILAIPVTVFFFNTGRDWFADQFDEQRVAIEKMDARLAIIEASDRIQDKNIGEHEYRMNTGRAAREAFQEKADSEFDSLGKKLEQINNKLGEVNSSVTAIETLINQRLPVRRTSLEDDQWRTPQ